MEIKKTMINLEVRLPDTPGSLIELIKPISKNGGNIYGIMHFHDRKVNNMIPVNINFELNPELKKSSLQNIKEELKENNIQIENITYGIEKRVLIVLLTGHVFDTDVLDTIKRLAANNITVSELQAKFTGLKEISNVKLKIEFPENLTKEELIIELRKICEEKNLFLITS
jgi:ACT domain-containing protein